MNKFYKRFLILIVLVLVISGTVIYTTVDINTLKNLTQFKTWSIALAILAVSLGLFFDGSRLMHLVKISDEKITLYQAVQVVFGNYFLALLTPGATGGAPPKSSCAATTSPPSRCCRSTPSSWPPSPKRSFPNVSACLSPSTSASSSAATGSTW